MGELRRRPLSMAPSLAGPPHHARDPDAVCKSPVAVSAAHRRTERCSLPAMRGTSNRALRSTLSARRSKPNPPYQTPTLPSREARTHELPTRVTERLTAGVVPTHLNDDRLRRAAIRSRRSFVSGHN